MIKHLFVYGTLMHDDIMLAVSGVLPVSVDAYLRGYRRLVVRGECYPGLCREEGGGVAGLLYLDIPQDVWPFLDAYEGEMYSREEVQIVTAEEDAVGAWVYMVKDDYLSQLEDKEWNYAKFLDQEKDAFLSQVRSDKGAG